MKYMVFVSVYGSSILLVPGGDRVACRASMLKNHDPEDYVEGDYGLIDFDGQSEVTLEP